MKEIVLVVALIGAATCATLLFELLARRPAFVAGMIFVFGGVTTIFKIDLRLVFGSITVFPADIVFGLIAGAAFVRILGLSRLSLAQASVTAIGLLALFSVARGATTDLATAVNEFRAMFYFLSGALYFITVEVTHELLAKITWLLYITALLIFAACIILWGEFLTGASLPDALADPWEGGFRVVTADRAMILAQASLVAMPAWFTKRHDEGGSERYLLLLLLPAVLLLQWRVVWILFVVGLIVLSLRHRTMALKALVPIVAIVAVALFLLPKVFTGDDAPSLSESFETTAESAEGTFLWRVEGWQELTKGGPGSTSEFLLGAPFGRGLDRVVGGQEVTTQAHSFYLDNYLRLGLAGVVLLVVIYGWAIRRFLSRPGTRSPGLTNPTMLLIVVVTQLIVFITFTPGKEQGLLAGVALSVAARSHSTGPYGSTSKPGPPRSKEASG